MKPRPTKNNFRSFLPVMIIVAIGLILYFTFANLGQSEYRETSYNDFYNAASAGYVKEVTINPHNYVAKGVMLSDKDKEYNFQTSIPPELVESVTQVLVENSSEVNFEPPSENIFLIIITNLAPFLLIIFFWLFMMRSMQGGGGQVLNFSKSKAKLFLDDRPRITFKDVAGVEEIKEELVKSLTSSRNPRNLSPWGQKCLEVCYWLDHLVAVKHTSPELLQERRKCRFFQSLALSLLRCLLELVLPGCGTCSLKQRSMRLPLSS